VYTAFLPSSRPNATEFDDMSKTEFTDGRTDDKPNAPNTHQLAAELGVDAELLARFEDEHPNPTAPIVIGWAHSRGELRCHPEQLRDEVEAWLAARPELPQYERNYEEALRADSLRAIRGGEE
jgi:hypothetical protein